MFSKGQCLSLPWAIKVGDYIDADAISSSSLLPVEAQMKRRVASPAVCYCRHDLNDTLSFMFVNVSDRSALGTDHFKAARQLSTAVNP